MTDKIMDKLRSAASLMPTTGEADRILNQRADYFANLVSMEKKAVQETTYVRFRIGENEYYGIPYQYVKEVMNNAMITRLPRSSAHIAGVINRRSVLVTVVDLQYLFHHQSAESVMNANIIIVAANNMTVGILVDAIDGSAAYDAENFTAPIASEGIGNMNYIAGLHNGNTAIINIEAMLADIQNDKG